MPRSTMATLITRVRDLINDPAGGSQVFTDDQIQDKLDARRADVRYLQMTAAPTLATGGVYQWLDYYTGEGGSGFTDWETDWSIQNGQWTALTTGGGNISSSDELTGHWVFTTTSSGGTNGQVPPVFITGKSYDVYGSAADILEMWIAKYTLAYAFSADGQSFQRNQIIGNLRTLVDEYRKMQRPTMIIATRSDLVQTNKMARVPLLGNNDILS